TVVFPTPPRRLDTAMKVVTEGFPRITRRPGALFPIHVRASQLKDRRPQLRAASSRWNPHEDCRTTVVEPREADPMITVENSGKPTARSLTGAQRSFYICIVVHEFALAACPP